MLLIIDLSDENLKLALKEKDKIIDSFKKKELYDLSETLLKNIDNLLKKNKADLKQIKDIKVIPSRKSITSTRIAQAVALGLKS